MTRNKDLHSWVNREFSTIRGEMTPNSQVSYEQLAQDLQALRSIRNLIGSSLTPDDLRSALFRIQLTEKVRVRLGQTFGNLKIKMRDLKDHQHEMAKRSIDDFGFKLNGNEFFTELLDKVRKHTRNEITQEVYNEILRLQHDVSEAFGEEFIPLVIIMFYCLHGDIKTLKKIVINQLGVKNAKQEKNSESSDFFEHARDFLSVFGDVSQDLRTRTGRKDIVLRESQQLLFKIMSDTRLRTDEPLNKFTETNMFTLLRESLQEAAVKGEGIHPWFWGNLAQSPFDAEKVGELITPDIPRAVLASALAKLNAFRQDEVVLDRKMRKVLEAYKGYKRASDNDKRIIDMQVNEVIRFLGAQGEEFRAPIVDRIKRVKNAYADHSHFELDATQMPEDGHDEENKTIYAAEYLLRVIHPKTIYQNQEVQEIFKEILESLPEDADLSASKILYTTLQTMLNSDDLYLDMPVAGLDGRKLRNILMQIAKRAFGNDAVRAKMEEKHGKLFSSIDAVGKSEVKKHFNTAAVGVNRMHIRRVAREMARTKSFPDLIRFAEREAQQYFHGKNMSYHFYASATEAFTELMNQLPDIQEGDNAIITNQEYDSITKFFTADGSKKEGVKVKPVYLNEKMKTRQRVYTVDEVFDQIIKKVNSRTRMVIISTKTRFGDAPCSASSELENTYYIAELIKKIRRAHPELAIVLDGCQALGRGIADNLSVLDADIYLTSGHKALGAGSAATMAVSSSFMKKTKFEQDTSPTRPIIDITAMALALHDLRHTEDKVREDGNYGELGKLSLDKRIQKHFAELTKYVIEEKAANFGDDFVMGHMLKGEYRNIWEKHDTKLVEWLGCKVIYPIHRNKNDYVGIVTMVFPALNGNKLARVIRKKGFRTIFCLEDQRAIRISFHYEHDREDIDELFNAIDEAIWKEVKDELLEHEDRVSNRCQQGVGWWPK